MAPLKDYTSLKHRQSRSPDSKSITLPEIERNVSAVPLHDRSDLFSNSRRSGLGNSRKRKPQPTIMNNLARKTKVRRKPQNSLNSSPTKSEEPRTKAPKIRESDINILDTFNTKRYQYDPSFDSSTLADETNDADDDSGSETDAQLINLQQLTSSPTRPLNNNKGEVRKLDELIASRSGKYEDYMKKVRNEQDIDLNCGFAVEILKGNILSTMEDRKRENIEAIRDKFKEKGYPNPISSKKLLLKKTEDYLYIIPQILKGKIGTTYFYDMAKSQCELSTHETMTQKEKWNINWQKYFGGYYGFKRQLFIASIIISRLKKDLQHAANRNKAVSYWTINGFSTFVLANEIIIRFVMEEFNCNMTKAESILKESSEFGTTVSDSTELVDDLKIGDLLEDEAKEFMKDIVLDDSRKDKNINEKAELEIHMNSNHSSTGDSKKQSTNILNQFLDTSSEEDI